MSNTTNTPTPAPSHAGHPMPESSISPVGGSGSALTFDNEYVKKNGSNSYTRDMAALHADDVMLEKRIKALEDSKVDVPEYLDGVRNFDARIDKLEENAGLGKAHELVHSLRTPVAPADIPASAGGLQLPTGVTALQQRIAQLEQGYQAEHDLRERAEGRLEDMRIRADALCDKINKIRQLTA